MPEAFMPLHYLFVNCQLVLRQTHWKRVAETFCN